MLWEYFTDPVTGFDPSGVLEGGLHIINTNFYVENTLINLDIGTNISFDNDTNHDLRFIIDPYGHVVIGLGTNHPRGAVDFRFAGKNLNDSTVGAYAAEIRYMLPPQVDDNAARTGLSTVAGALIYNVDTGKHQGYDGTQWHDFYW